MGGVCWKYGETGLLDEEKEKGKRLGFVGYANEVWVGKDVFCAGLTFYFNRRSVIAFLHQATEEDGDVVDIALLEDRGVLFGFEVFRSAFIPKI